ncbi:hypothetical protein LOK49_LG11G02918 [Camellia lanceoleosa]|uniref:Uncharacterized protein n=1 Tax=Camellia lanceoleosa TaxID=1840588 RepID=A0ACC0G4M0_9ERIC|nr:hypothetical protein LOK49_LG11G02918 [Camellia lanceoleosa]
MASIPRPPPPPPPPPTPLLLIGSPRLTLPKPTLQPRSSALTPKVINFELMADSTPSPTASDSPLPQTPPPRPLPPFKDHNNKENSIPNFPESKEDIRGMQCGEDGDGRTWRVGVREGHIDGQRVQRRADRANEGKKRKDSPIGSPRVFVKERYVGGVEEVMRIVEDGCLGNSEGLPKLKMVMVVKEEMSMSTQNHGKTVVVRCPDCNENGLVLRPSQNDPTTQREASSSSSVSMFFISIIDECK